MIHRQRNPLQIALDDYPGLTLMVILFGVFAGIAWFTFWGVHFPASLILSVVSLVGLKYYRNKHKIVMPRWQLLWCYALCIFATPAALALYAITNVEKWGEWFHTEA